MFTHFRSRRSSLHPLHRRSSALGVECLEDRRLLSAESLINLDLFRADPRFAEINGSGMAAVIIDTGADLDHPFFGPDNDNNGVADRIVFQWDFADDDDDASDASGSGHGSHVASIVASGDTTYPGMAPGSDIIILKVFRDGDRSADLEVMQDALQWVEANATAYNIVSVNMSLGSGNFSDPQSGPPISDELERLAAQNVIVVAAAGNLFFSEDGTPGVGYPAADPNTLAVGAVWAGSHGMQSLEGAIDFTTAEDRIAAYSQRDPQLTDIFAPGGLITGANQSGGATTRRGTSMAAPHIAGIAVLAQQLAMRELGRLLTPAEFRELLTTTGAIVHDGDDEDDNVTNTGADYARVDVLSLAEAILVNPGVPSVTISNTTITEGDLPGTHAVFTVRISFTSEAPIFIGYTTADGTATVAAGDYQQTGGVLTFPPGGPTHQQIAVPITSDIFDEPNETLHVVLVDAAGANIARSQGTATIIDDDEQLGWHNAVEPRDVNNDGLISGLDALIIINQLNSNGIRLLPDNPEFRTPWYFYDVSDDGLLSALDALIVINWLNAPARQSVAAEGAADVVMQIDEAVQVMPLDAPLAGPVIAGETFLGDRLAADVDPPLEIVLDVARRRGKKLSPIVSDVVDLPLPSDGTHASATRTSSRLYAVHSTAADERVSGERIHTFALLADVPDGT